MSPDLGREGAEICYFSLQDSTASGTGPNSSTPLKDSTPTNQGENLDHKATLTLLTGVYWCVDVSETQDVTTEEEQIEVETGVASSSSAVVQLGDIPEVKDIVESSDC